MRIVHCKQATPEWWLERRGIPSASNFDMILTPKTYKPSSSQDRYICQLIADRARLAPPDDLEKAVSRAMQNGIDTEPEARKWYSMTTGLDVEQVGLCVTDDERFCCSPDGLVGDEGGLELKCPDGATHVSYLLGGGLPDDYKWQVHGSLIVTGRKWWDFVSYFAGDLPQFRIRVEPNEDTERLRKALDDFHVRYQTLINEIKLLDGRPLAA